MRSSEKSMSKRPEIGGALAAFATVFLVCFLLDWKRLALGRNLLVSFLGALCFLIAFVIYDVVAGRRQHSKE